MPDQILMGMTQKKAEKRFLAKAKPADGHQPVLKWGDARPGSRWNGDPWRKTTTMTCSCGGIRNTRESTKDGSISRALLTAWNRHVEQVEQAHRRWTPEEMRPVKVGEASGPRSSYEGWVFHMDNIPEHVIKGRTHSRWMLDLSDEQLEQWRRSRAPWLIGQRNSNGWKLEAAATQSSAISYVVSWLNKLKLQGKTVTLTEQKGNVGVEALPPTMKEAVTTMMTEVDSIKDINHLKILLEEAEDARAALVLYEEKLRQELQNLFTID